MATLWTEILNPADLTGYAREALEEYERAQGTLARFLPNRFVADISVRYIVGSGVLQEIANFRAYDAAPEIGKLNAGKRYTVELPALGLAIPIGEYAQLRQRNASPDVIKNQLLDAVKAVTIAVANRMEFARGEVLKTGSATTLGAPDTFGRKAAFTATATTLFDAADADIIGQIQDLTDLYRVTNGMNPGVMLTSTRVQRVMQNSRQFRTQLLDGSSRPATASDIAGVLSGANLPSIELYDRHVNTASGVQRVLSDDMILFLPAPVGVSDWQATELGATFWGQTLTSQEPGWNIADSEQPGIVVGAFKNELPPVQATVVSDAIGMPILAKADQSLALKAL